MNLIEDLSKVKNPSIKDIQSVISSHFHKANYNSIVFRNQRFEGLYRARKHNQIDGESDSYKFINEKEFWCPTPNNIASRGRCNDVSESMFYSSNQFETAVLEVQPKEGEYITVANFIPLNSYGFTIKPICIQYLKKVEDYSHLLHKYDISKQNKKFKRIDNILDDLFTKVVSDKDNYKTTNAITKCMLTDIRDAYSRDINTNIHGMVYPSIANRKNSINVLLKPIYALTGFSIQHLQTFKILSTTSDKIRIKLVRNGKLMGNKLHLKGFLNINWLPIINGEVSQIYR